MSSLNKSNPILHDLQDLCSPGPETSNLQPIFKLRFNFFQYILNYRLTQLYAIGNEQIPVHHTAATEDPVENTPTINTDDATVLNTNTAVSNDENNVDMQYVTASATAMKINVDDDSSDEESRPNAKKMSAASSPACMPPDTELCQKRGKEEICQGTPPSLSPLNQGNRGPMGDLYLLFTLQVLLQWGPRGEVLTSIIKSPHHNQYPNSKKIM